MHACCAVSPKLQVKLAHCRMSVAIRWSVSTTFDLLASAAPGCVLTERPSSLHRWRDRTVAAPASPHWRPVLVAESFSHRISTTHAAGQSLWSSKAFFYSDRAELAEYASTMDTTPEHQLAKHDGLEEPVSKRARTVPAESDVGKLVPAARSTALRSVLKGRSFHTGSCEAPYGGCTETPRLCTLASCSCSFARHVFHMTPYGDAMALCAVQKSC